MKDLIKNFEKYLLEDVGISKSTSKFYRSDLSHFKAWLIFKIKSLGIMAEDFIETIPLLSKNIAFEYKKFLVENDIPQKTANRRLSTLRHLSRFLTLNQIIDSDFMEGLTNIKNQTPGTNNEHLIHNFERFLTSQKVSQNTSKNYIADIKQFFNWFNTQSTISHN